MKTFEQLYNKIMTDLENNLPKYLTYHNHSHTKHVIAKTILIAEKEKVSEHDLFLLKMAALFHDTGYLIGSENHEDASCRIARRELADSGFESNDIEQICGLIMATKIPQRPKNQLEEILADADLDYLGTDAFYSIGEKLYSELRNLGIIANRNEWYRLQIGFLSKHQYHTDFSKKYREPVKQMHLKEILNKLDSNSSGIEH